MFNKIILDTRRAISRTHKLYYLICYIRHRVKLLILLILRIFRYANVFVMKKFLIVILLITCMTFGQNKNKSKNKLDSLIRVLKVSFSDTNYRNPDSALILVNNALPEYKDDALANAWKNHFKGTYYYLKQNADSSLHYYSKSLKDLDPLEDPFLFNENKVLLSIVYKNIGNRDQAEALLKEAESQLIGSKNTSPELWINLCRAYGAFYNQITQHDKGISYYLKALDYMDEQDDPDEKIRANLSMNLAETFHRINDSAKALSYFKETRKLCEKINFPFGVHVADQRIAQTKRNFMTEEEFDNLLVSVSFFEKINIPQKIIEGKTAIGTHYQFLEQSEKAKELYIEALVLSKKISYQTGIGNLNYELGSLYEENNLYNKAIGHYEEAFNVFQHLKEYRALRSTSERLSSLLEKNNKFKKSIFLLKCIQDN